MIPFENPKFKDVGEGKTEKHGYKKIHGMIIKKLGDFKETQSENGRFSALIVGVYIRTVVKAAKVYVCSERILENLSLCSLWAINGSYPSLENFYDFPVPPY